MNLIQKQAADFYDGSEHSGGFGQYKPFIDEVKLALYDYRKTAHNIEFVDTIINRLKQEFDAHMAVCKTPKTCGSNKYYENTLFFFKKKSKT